MSVFDNISNQMSDFIGADPNDNTVSNVMDQIYPQMLDSDTGSLAKQAQKEQRAEDKYASQSVLGSPYGGPLAWTERLTGLSRFFSGAEKGNTYTDSFKKPQQQEPVKAVDPQQFYAKWYESMRRFAEAEEVSSRGQTVVRNR